MEKGGERQPKRHPLWTHRNSLASLYQWGSGRLGKLEKEDPLSRFLTVEESIALKGLPRWLGGKGSTWQGRKCVFYPWFGRSPGEGNVSPLQCSCLGNPMDRGARRAARGHRTAGRDSAAKQRPALDLRRS